MRKLKLDLDALVVESFQVTAPSADDGTVQGRMIDNSPPTEFSCIDCAGAPSVGTCIGPTFCCPATWKATCAATCFYTECGPSCWTWLCNSCRSCPGTCDAAPTCDHAGTTCTGT